MASQESKRRLTEFLDEKAFQPVLRADPDDYPESEQDKLRDVQRATESERKRFQSYDTAEKVYQMFQDDLNSEPAQDVHRELHDLGLPTLNDIRQDFETLAHEVGVR